MDNLNQMAMGNCNRPYMREGHCRNFQGQMPMPENMDKGIDNYPIGMAYVPWQKFRDLFCNEYESLERGTIFKELYLPWVGRGCR